MPSLSERSSEELVVFFPVFKKTFIPENHWIKAISVGDNSDYALNDKTGDSIAHLNRFYNELTAIYWAWKNYPLPKYVGFSNYRKWMNHTTRSMSFGTEIFVEPSPQLMGWLSSGEQYQAILSRMAIADAILAQPQVYPMSISEQFKRSHSADIWDTFIRAHSEVNTKYMANIKWYDVCTAPQFFQSFVMRKDDFCNYCSELFKIVNHVFRIHGELDSRPGERFQAYRYPAFLAERFLMFYAWANFRKMINSQIIMLERN